ncbi:MAG: universal stress protein [Halodesulfurarchaeum sp.]
MTDKPTVLVPLQVLEGESIPEGVPALLSGASVMILGYHVLPEQTATEQGREQFGERAMNRLTEFEEMVSSAGADVETRLVFTHEAQQTINRVLVEEDCFAVLIPKATPPVEEVLVPVRGTVGRERLVRVLASLFADTDATITLFHVEQPEETDETIRTLLGDLEAALVEAGIEGENVLKQVVTGEKPLEAITTAAEHTDVVVMGETDPSVATFVFGLPEEQLADEFLGPVLIVQRPPPEQEGTEAPGQD